MYVGSISHMSYVSYISTLKYYQFEVLSVEIA